MSQINNVLTKYFRRIKRNVNNESIIQPAVSTDEQEKEEIEIESPSFKRLKLSEDKGSSTSVSPTCSRALESLTISASSQPSSPHSILSKTSSQITSTQSSKSGHKSSPTGARAVALLTISARSLAPTTTLSSSIRSSTSTSSPQTTTPLAPPINSPPSSTSNRSPPTTALTSPMNSPSSTSTCSTPATPLVSPINSPSSTSTCSIPTTALTSSINSPPSASLLPSNERDPCLGPAAAKQFVFLGLYQPDFKFPTVQNRHFCRQWYSIYSWLEYSPTIDRAFCYVCRLLYGSGKIDSWFTVTGFNSWKNAIARLNNHQSSVTHKQALQTWTDLKKNYNNNSDVLKLIDKQHKKQAAENRAYLVEINEIIELLQQQILTGILNECRRAKYFSVIIDETKDIACHEQVSVVIRFVDEKFNVFEKFIGFERIATMTGEALTDLLIKWLKKFNLNLQNLVGQCYDGASNMRGEYQGVAARLSQIAPLGIYIHCNGHVLNLCLIDVSARVPSVRDTFGVVSSLYKLVEGSVKRHQVFERVQQEAGLKKLTIKEVCETRWTCRLECLKVILLRFNEIITTLEVIEVPDAFLLLNSLLSFDFIFHLFIMMEIYFLTNILSKFLQHSNVSLTDVLAQVKITIDTLKSLQNETEFERIYNEVLKLCNDNGIEPPEKPRTKRIPVRFGGSDDGTAGLNVKDYYRIKIYYVILDNIITSINHKFDENILGVVVLMEKLFLYKECLNEDELHELTQFYSINYDDLKAEQRLYKNQLNDKKMNLSEVTELFLENNFHIALSSMNELLKILWTIPVNSCQCERSFSCLKRLKTYLRNSMGEERLSGIALLNIERNFEINLDQIVTDFIVKKDIRKTIF
ncbi:unnamed protein product [Rotaria sordida]|uniref:TTF-type domain-containing protein n=1 Tax=Rotaria sordida TaxID=392033 RepID=A0A819HU91_9BILA|nr:unnamed protein product [Rotaria sordida]